jgi:hypothetical protein
MKYIVWLAVIVFLIAIGPLATIWALNTLFPVLVIPYTFDTWVAVVIVGALFKTKVTVDK